MLSLERKGIPPQGGPPIQNLRQNRSQVEHLIRSTPMVVEHESARDVPVHDRATILKYVFVFSDGKAATFTSKITASVTLEWGWESRTRKIFHITATCPSGTSNEEAQASIMLALVKDEPRLKELMQVEMAIADGSILEFSEVNPILCQYEFHADNHISMKRAA